ncbi:DUF1571 domain-containing protein [Rhodopirellula sp.]|nr:DUF1571 domain-containing protein [bacterium]MDB4393847.1 DUF1571 domain-containing protein [Rhodopirellula sp.]MDB4532893.1 DUF1571 domain-containing protein [bacterium]MDB4770908.1 DUF1571 domain-containing protein [bacterium]
MTPAQKKKIFAICFVVGMLGGYYYYQSLQRTPNDVANASPTSTEQAPNIALNMADVLDMAKAAKKHLSTTLKDYTARFVKQELDSNGNLGPESEIEMKVQTRCRNENNDAPMRVYLSFNAPQSQKGREVIWGADLFDGTMAVHEVGFLLGLKTLWLDPTGFLAMQGQKYPVSEVGIMKLIDKLIERGEKDRDNPDISVKIITDQKLDDTPTHMIQIRRSKPSNEEDDFSLAEITLDPERQLILGYRAFGWPDEPGGAPVLLESYTYHDVQTNVGLTDADFDPKNPKYNFPAL